jgi:carbon-monoxide dehydrogenase large subunit
LPEVRSDPSVTKLLTGHASFAGDLLAPGMLHLVFVRSPVAHATITRVDTADAARAPGVVGVFVAGDLPIVPVWEIAMVPEHLAQPALADGVVRYVGERVAAVAAETLAAAVDAAELVEVEYDELDVVADIDEATAPAAPALFGHLADNVCLAWDSDDPGAADAASSASASLRLAIPRLSTAPMEPHAVLAVPAEDGGLTVHASTQVPTAARAQIARTLVMDPAKVRVVAPFVGGGFGGKAAGAIGEHMVAAAIARELRRPVRFVEARTDNLVGMQGRGVRNAVTLHARADGRLTGLTADISCDAGAYPNVGAVEPGKTRMMASGPYRLSFVDARARAVLTNRAPVGAYRGPGRSEASLMLERTLDVLAADLGIDPVEIRRRNLVPPDAFPYTTATQLVYDSGDYPALLDALVARAGYDALRDEQRSRRAAGAAPMGIGIAVVVDSTAWFSRDEAASVRLERDGTVVVRAGSVSSGQRHDVVYRDLVRSVLPLPDERIRVIEGDTGEWDSSAGTMGSRTAQLAGTAVVQATLDLVARLRELTAAMLEADPADIVLHASGGGAECGFAVRGVPASVVPLTALAERHAATSTAPIESACLHQQEGATYPAAAHLSVVDIDRDTGRVTARRHVAVTDCGRVLDEASVRGQVVGATVQGIAQALYEEAVHDRSGTPLTSSFVDYGIPSAADVPPVEVHLLETPSPRNPLGAKGVGEIGMLAAPAAVLNAVVDALAPFGVRHLDLPCTPSRVWRALHGTPKNPNW